MTCAQAEQDHHLSRRQRHCPSEIVDILVGATFRPLGLDLSPTQQQASPSHPALLCSAGAGRGLDAFLSPYVEQTATAFVQGMRSAELPLYLHAWLQSIAAIAVTPQDVGAFVADCIGV